MGFDRNTAEERDSREMRRSTSKASRRLRKDSKMAQRVLKEKTDREKDAGRTKRDPRNPG